ncbi:hypothetical protein POVWA1_042340 [Plasmodium ovale wallikeri]|nr:hypothetical protein POVWA1_042340 [Plasmodium ovale wallikeri]
MLLHTSLLHGIARLEGKRDIHIYVRSCDRHKDCLLFVAYLCVAESWEWKVGHDHPLGLSTDLIRMRKCDASPFSLRCVLFCKRYERVMGLKFSLCKQLTECKTVLRMYG